MRTLGARSCAFALLAGLAAMMWVAEASAVTPIDSCPETLAKPGETYVVTADLTASGTCFTIAADRITIDFKGHDLVGDGSGVGVTDDGIARLLTTVKNGAIGGFETGIDLAASTRSQVLNMEVFGNVGDGILVGTKSLVKTCLVQFNDADGVSVGDFAQVQDCLVQQNGAGGIVGASHVLITGVASLLNLGSGITTGTFGTVTFSLSDANGLDGINADARSLVNFNFADNNGGNGIVGGVSQLGDEQRSRRQWRPGLHHPAGLPQPQQQVILAPDPGQQRGRRQPRGQHPRDTPAGEVGYIASGLNLIGAPERSNSSRRRQ